MFTVKKPRSQKSIDKILLHSKYYSKFCLLMKIYAIIFSKAMQTFNNVSKAMQTFNKKIKNNNKEGGKIQKKKKSAM